MESSRLEKVPGNADSEPRLVVPLRVDLGACDSEDAGENDNVSMVGPQRFEDAQAGIVQ